ncbi:MAG TPA: universal stress protein [Candidatus Acidoferrum sp.]|nr:universal stress protein [Candidatus Acidoferrum sp.]
MASVEASKRIRLKSILYLTDFSEPSEAALPFAIEIARAYGASVYALHVLVPSSVVYMTPESPASAIEWQEEAAMAEMQRVDAQLMGLPHETIVERGSEIWPAFEQALREHEIDLIVLGTHGRTGVQKFLLGSAAEEVFRRSRAPVITIGPGVRSGVHNDARFRRVLFPTDFTPESLAAEPYAVSLAQENQARLMLLHVITKLGQRRSGNTGELSVAEAMHWLYELVPEDAELWCRPEALVEHGEPADRILQAAEERGADLIVLGVRDAASHLTAATHLDRTTAYKIVANAHCPVLTVRE